MNNELYMIVNFFNNNLNSGESIRNTSNNTIYNIMVNLKELLNRHSHMATDDHYHPLTMYDLKYETTNIINEICDVTNSSTP